MASADQLKVLSVGISREFQVQLGRSGLLLFASLLEPVAHILIMCAWYYGMRIKPPVGTSPLLFVATGLYPLFVFVHLSLSARASALNTGVHNRFPIETGLDTVLARYFVKLSCYLLTGLVLFSGIAMFDTDSAIPIDAATVTKSIVCLSMMGFGMGLLNSAIELYLPMWRFIWGPASRLLILISGIMFIPDLLPVHLRDYLIWNPVLHAIVAFRLGFYDIYPRFVYDPIFPWVASLVLLAMGLCAERVARSFPDRY